MKTFTTILILSAALICWADVTPTSAVKISALSSATTPLTGAEIVPLLQSGATKTATVNQINAAPIAQGNAFSNNLQAQISAEISTRVANTGSTSNSLQTQITAETSARVAGDGSTSNSLQSQITAETSARVAGDGSTSNSLQSQITAGQTYSSAVSNNLQTQISVLSGGQTGAGSSPSFGIVTVTNLIEPSIDLGLFNAGGSPTFQLPANLAGLERLEINPISNNGKYIYFQPTNLVDGLNMTFLLQNTNGANSANINMVAPVGNWGWHLGSGQQNVTAGHIMTISLSVIWTNVFVTLQTF